MSMLVQERKANRHKKAKHRLYRFLGGIPGVDFY